MPKLGVVKPYDIPKQAVWEAYRKVAANKGAPGVDELNSSGTIPRPI